MAMAMTVSVCGRTGGEVEEGRAGDAGCERAHRRREGEDFFDEGGRGHGGRRCFLNAVPPLLDILLRALLTFPRSRTRSAPHAVHSKSINLKPIRPTTVCPK